MKQSEAFPWHPIHWRPKHLFPGWHPPRGFLISSTAAVCAIIAATTFSAHMKKSQGYALHTIKEAVLRNDMTAASGSPGTRRVTHFEDYSTFSWEPGNPDSKYRVVNTNGPSTRMLLVDQNAFGPFPRVELCGDTNDRNCVSFTEASDIARWQLSAMVSSAERAVKESWFPKVRELAIPLTDTSAHRTGLPIGAVNPTNLRYIPGS